MAIWCVSLLRKVETTVEGYIPAVLKRTFGHDDEKGLLTSNVYHDAFALLCEKGSLFNAVADTFNDP